MSAANTDSEFKEIELKLVFEPADAFKLSAHPFFANTARVLPRCGPRVLETKTRELISVYYDTPDDALRKAGLFLRVRNTGAGFVQTVKTARGDSEFLERDEWECNLSSDSPDLAAAEETALGPLLSDKVRAALDRRFETRFHRQTFLVEYEGSLIEVAIDQGDIVAGEKRSRVCELELELKSGDRAALFSFAKRLAETVPLTLGIKTKAERGFDLLDGREADFEKARPVEIPAGETCAEAFRIAARNCMRQALVNLPGTRAGHAEALHQTRVGLRRLRAAISLFSEVVEGPQRQHIAEELKWIAGQLGPARDLDVFISDILEPHRAAFPDDPGWESIQARILRSRAAAYNAAFAATGSERFRQALLDVGAWIEFGDWTGGGNRLADEPVADYASAKLAKLRRSIVKTGKHLGSLSIPERHRLRIRAKRMRYGSEFFGATFGGKGRAKRCAKALAALEKLQDTLGVLNDIANRQTFMDGGGDRPEQAMLPMPKVYPSEEKTLMKKAKRAYARFAETKPFWKA